LLNEGVLYSALDKYTGETVALKIEKADKSKKILQFEYQVLKKLQGILPPLI
jgi:predicted Ser/Thr protein kinase